MNKASAILLLVLILIIIIYIRYHNGETFATKREKANAIFDWFSKTSNPSYVEYRSTVGRNSNIVEYNQAVHIFKEHANPTVSLIEQAL